VTCLCIIDTHMTFYSQDHKHWSRKKSYFPFKLLSKPSLTLHTFLKYRPQNFLFLPSKCRTAFIISCEADILTCRFNKYLKYKYNYLLFVKKQKHLWSLLGSLWHQLLMLQISEYFHPPPFYLSKCNILNFSKVLASILFTTLLV
jgi:hypothetical protein